MAKKTIRLEKIGATGARLYWEARINEAEVDYEYGQVGGAAQIIHEIFTKGKNDGKANETSPAYQCLFEAERKARKKMENSYQLISGELETVGKTVKATDVTIPKPMLAKTYDDQEKNVAKWRNIYVQPKLDGNRCLINIMTGKMYSRSRKEIINIPDLGQAVMDACVNLKGIEWADGELYSDELSFREIQSIIRQANSIHPNADKINFHMFDYISEVPFCARALAMENEVIENDRVIIVPSTIVPIDKIRVLHNTFVEEGYEGIILRNPDMPYEEKRSSGLIKYKLFRDEEFRVIDWSPEKNDETLMGAAILETADGEIFKARPAMSELDKAEIWENRDAYIGMMAIVKFQEKDPVSGIPRFPILKGFRDASDVD
jgi:DNA ligase 1